MPPQDSPPSPARGAAAPDSRPTADRILDAAEDCFARKGFDGTTLRDVADIVGIRIPSLYNHFDGKQSLYVAVLERGMAPILDMLTRAITSDDDQSGSDPRAFVTGLMAVLAERPSLPRLVQYEMLAGGDNLALMLEGWLRPTMERSLALLRDTPASAHWKPEQLPHLLIALLNMIIGHFAMSPLVDQVLGGGTNDEAAMARATEFYGEVAEQLTFGGPPAANPQPGAPHRARPEGPPDPDQEQQS